jgi:hypothetical protein
MAKDNLDKMTEEESMTQEERENFMVDRKRKKAYFNTGLFTSFILGGVSCAGMIAGAYYDKPEYFAIGACGYALSLLYDRNLLKEITNSYPHLENIISSKNDDQTNNKNKQDLKG